MKQFSDNHGSALGAVLIFIAVFMVLIIALLPVAENNAQLSAVSERAFKHDALIEGAVTEAQARMFHDTAAGIQYTVTRDNSVIAVTVDQYSAVAASGYNRAVTVGISVQSSYDTFTRYRSFSTHIKTPVSAVSLGYAVSSGCNIADIASDSDGFLYTLISDEFGGPGRYLKIFRIQPENTIYRDVTSDTISITEIETFDIDQGSYPTGISVKNSYNAGRNTGLPVAYVSYLTGGIYEMVLNSTRTAITSSSQITYRASDEYYDTSFDGNDNCFFAAYDTTASSPYSGKYMFSAGIVDSMSTVTFDGTGTLKDIQYAGQHLYLLMEYSAGNADIYKINESTRQRVETISVDSLQCAKLTVYFDTALCAVYTDLAVSNVYDGSVTPYTAGIPGAESICATRDYLFMATSTNIYTLNSGNKSNILIVNH